jgi:lysophospholipase L1-like esterase
MTPTASQASESIQTESLPQEMSPEEAAEWRTRHYGNEGFQERLRIETAGLRGVAVGDSWFDYIPARLLGPGDVLDCLVSTGQFNIYRTAKAGDTVEDMVWGTDFWSCTWDPRLKHQLSDAIDAIRTTQPNFFLFSGGGNDIAGDTFADYLDHAAYGGSALRQESLSFLINSYLRAAFRALFDEVQRAKAGLPIFFHGYNYPVADGRAVINGPLGFHWIGPWLRPALAKKRIDHAQFAAVLTSLIDMYNAMLSSLHDPGRNIFYVDLRNSLRTLYGKDPDGYQKAWANELHPSNEGFKLIARKFAQEIKKTVAPPT